MVDNHNRHPLHGETLPRNTYARIATAIENLAQANPTPLNLSDTFLWAEASLTEAPDQVIGSRTPLGGDLEKGKIDAIWFNETGTELIGQALGGEEVSGSVLGQISFAKQKDGVFFNGDIFLFSANEVEIRVYCKGTEPDSDLAQEFFAFADSVGLGNLWQDTLALVNQSEEQEYTGELNPPGGMRMAYALQQLLRSKTIQGAVHKLL
ncbi:MAG TPA: hypothetical protein VLG37_04435 [Candidatus Saccharimonadales bacterium]|nr:hypothetical protein [Candidatus Saccharimonadales bacterium]